LQFRGKLGVVARFFSFVIGVFWQNDNFPLAEGVFQVLDIIGIEFVPASRILYLGAVGKVGCFSMAIIRVIHG
jgi:hypothetical protein